MIAVIATPPARPRAFMEHRWGVRVELDHAVEIRFNGERHEGRLRNASISGALIATDATPPWLTPIEVSLAAHIHGEARELRLDARVVRTEDGCLGVEWSDMACWPLMELLNAARAGTSIDEHDRAFG